MGRGTIPQGSFGYLQIVGYTSECRTRIAAYQESRATHENSAPNRHTCTVVAASREQREKQMRLNSGEPMPCGNTMTIDGASVAARLSISISHFHALRSSGRFGPTPIRLGRAVRYSCPEVEAWAASGAPPLDRWTWEKPGKTSPL